MRVFRQPADVLSTHTGGNKTQKDGRRGHAEVFPPEYVIRAPRGGERRRGEEREESRESEGGGQPNLLGMHVFAFNTFFDDVDRGVSRRPVSSSSTCARIRTTKRKPTQRRSAAKIITLSEGKKPQTKNKKKNVAAVISAGVKFSKWPGNENEKERERGRKRRGRGDGQERTFPPPDLVRGGSIFSL